MVNQNTTIMATAILVALIFTGVPCLEAQSPVGSPMMSPTSPTTTGPSAPDCLTALTNVSDCLSFVQVGSNMTAPDKACCPEFAGLLESNPICLCELVGSSDTYGVDLSRALMLPDACKVEVPSLDSCPATPTSAPTPTSTGEAPGSSAGKLFYVTGPLQSSMAKRFSLIHYLILKSYFLLLGNSCTPLPHADVVYSFQSLES